MAAPLAGLSIEFVLKNGSIEYLGDVKSDGEIKVKPGKPIRFTCTRPFALFINVEPGGSKPAPVDKEPFDNEGLVIASKLDPGNKPGHEMKVKVKGALKKGDGYKYGLAVLNSTDTFVTVDPRILID